MKCLFIVYEQFNEVRYNYYIVVKTGSYNGSIARVGWVGVSQNKLSCHNATGTSKCSNIGQNQGGGRNWSKLHSLEANQAWTWTVIELSVKSLKEEWVYEFDPSLRKFSIGSSFRSSYMGIHFESWGAPLGISSFHLSNFERTLET